MLLDQLVIDPFKYAQRVNEDNEYLASRRDLMELLQRKFTQQIYRKTFKGLPAAAIVNGVFVHKRATDDLSFQE